MISCSKGGVRLHLTLHNPLSAPPPHRDQTPGPNPSFVNQNLTGFWRRYRATFLILVENVSLFCWVKYWVKRNTHEIQSNWKNTQLVWRRRRKFILFRWKVLQKSVFGANIPNTFCPRRFLPSKKSINPKLGLKPKLGFGFRISAPPPQPLCKVKASRTPP